MKNNNELDKDFNTVDTFLLKQGDLSWDERLLIEYIRKHPEEKEKIIGELKK